MQLSKEVFEIIFPKGLFEWFDITESKTDDENVYITLEEKDIPPVTPDLKDKKIYARKFHDITVTDFPIRGKRTLLTVRRRYWQVEGQTTYLKRNIKLNFPGTQLEQEFAVFLKEASRDVADLADLLGYTKPPTA
jgi:hypothetical protein